ncbi:aminoglycoside phosphotransferase family protein [Micromonospora sp. DR5-3]|uniref:phosphotransferase n=1 Tax=unclassified Micromonospora TaxID=2617518 RepID=UPI0011D923C2|nr:MULTISPECIES: phosphotransferase [unclassified Micromonospora]MCW3819176.1 aminoglycoside phosphotransferase family protein [Micromonospora sp. DR5-3]TYC21080.1 aminoglycoside phosphotransferase [Micromonospora sp. MP36]
MTRPPLDLVPAEVPAHPLTHNPLNGVTGGIWRTHRNGRPAVLKLITPPRHGTGPTHWAASADVGHWNYWRREVEAYGSGLAATAWAGAGLAAPDVLAVEERPDGTVALWLADMDGRPGTVGTIGDFGEVARRLGVAHADWLDRTAELPRYDWLARDWLRDYTLSRPVTEPVPWDHPAAVVAWPASLRTTLRRLWERRHAVLAATDRLPRTLCHHDVWPTNLILAGGGPVLLDWSFVGPGPIGEDAANLVLDTFFDGLVDVALLPDVADAVLTGYVEGLRGVADPALVARAVRIAGAAKYFWLAPVMLNRAGGATGQTYDQRDEAAMFAGRRPVLELLADWSAAALD